MKTTAKETIYRILFSCLYTYIWLVFFYFESDLKIILRDVKHIGEFYIFV